AGASVHGDLLTKYVLVADQELGRLAGKGSILRVCSKYGMRMNDVVSSNARGSEDASVSQEHRSLAQLDVITHIGERTNPNPFSQPGAGFHHRRRMDSAVLGAGQARPDHPSRSTIDAKTPPCAHTVSSTGASPRSFHTLDRCWITSTKRSSRSPGVTVWRNLALSIPR